MKREIRSYMKQIKKQLRLLYSKKETDAIINNLFSSIEDFTTDNPSCTIDDIKKYLKVESGLSDWIENASIDQALNKIDESGVKKNIYTIVIVSIVIFIFICFLTVFIEHWMINDSWNHIIVIKK